MDNFFTYITKKWISTSPENKREYRSEIGILQGWVSIFINTFLFAIKVMIAISTHSISIMADALHTLSDTVSSAIVVWGFKQASLPADREHPYGHGRFEHVATLILSVLLMVTGLEFIKSSFSRLIQPVSVEIYWFWVGIMFVTIIIKEMTAKFAQFLSVQIESDALKADAWHHRSDAISTMIVILAMIAGKFEIYIIDSLAGFGIAGFIIWTGFSIAKNAINDLVGRPPTDEELRLIKSKSEMIEGVLGVHDVSLHSYGLDKYGSIHLEVDHRISTSQAHDIAETVENHLMDEIGMIPTVHIDPINLDHPMIKEINQFLHDTWKQDSRIKNFHDIRIIEQTRKKIIMFGAKLANELSREEILACRKEIIEKTTNRFPNFQINLRLSALYNY